MTGEDKYAESLAAELYWAHEQWLRKIDPYHAMRPLWAHMSDEYKAPYRDMAKSLIQAAER